MFGVLTVASVGLKSVPQRGSVWVAAMLGTLEPIIVTGDPHATALWY